MDSSAMTMTMGDYLFYSLMGISVVFFALVLLMCIIKIMTYKPAKADTAAAAATEGAAAAAAPADKTLAPGSAGDVKLYDTDPRTAAMVMAIVADELKKPVNELRFISIREVKK